MSRKERSVISKSSGEINKFKKKKCSIIPQGIKKNFFHEEFKKSVEVAS